MRRNTLIRFGAGAVVTMALTGVTAPVASADFDAGYIATASASGMRSSYVLPGQVVVEEVWDFGGPVAEARLDVSGGSGFASLPFPGAAGVVGAGLVLNLAGLSDTVPTPEYPFYAGAQYPVKPSTQVGQPGGNYALTAKADQKAAASAAEFRGGPKEGFVGESLARSDVTETNRSVVASAESVNKGISLGGGALTIGSVLSQATTTLGADGTVTGVSKLMVEGLEVGGKPAGLSPAALDEAALNQALAPLGLSLHVVEGQTRSTGVTGRALEVRLVHPIPEGGGNNGTLVYRFGAAAADIITAPGSDQPAGGTDTAVAQAAGPAAPAAAPIPISTAAPATAAVLPNRSAAPPMTSADPAPVRGSELTVTGDLRFEPLSAVSTTDTSAASSSWTSTAGLAIIGAAVLLASLPLWLRLGGKS